MKTIASFMAVCMLVLAFLIQVCGMEMDFQTILQISTLGVFAGSIASFLWSFRQVMPDFFVGELCAA